MSAPLLIDEPPLQVLPSLATAIGLNRAIILQQLHYCLRLPPPRVYEREGRRWVRNTYANWKKYHFPFWDDATIKRHFLGLEEDGLVISRQYDMGRGAGDKFYSIDYERLREIRPGHVEKEKESEGPGDSFQGEFDPLQDEAEENPFRQLIADICRFGPIDQIINFKRLTILTKGEANLRSIGATMESLRAWSDWWRTIDWRGSKGEAPAGPQMIYDTWHQFQDWYRLQGSAPEAVTADPECENCHGDRFYLSDPNDLDSQLLECRCAREARKDQPARARSRA